MLAALCDWLLAPIDPSRAHLVEGALAWHARLMTAAWIILAPLGVVAARFFKIMPRQDWPARLDAGTWWLAHRACQYLAVLLSLAAALLVLALIGGPRLRTIHGALGWTVLALAAVQVFGGWLRGSKGGPTAPDPQGGLRGDHYDMSARRVAFERVHKSAGYLALATGLAAVLSGLWQVNGPRWMWLAIAGWTVLFLGVFAVFQRRGMAIDTYQAIWGNGADLPGASRTPIGWGVRRLGQGEKP